MGFHSVGVQTPSERNSGGYHRFLEEFYRAGLDKIWAYLIKAGG